MAIWFDLPAGSYSISDCVGFRDLLSAAGGDLGHCSSYRFGDGRLLETGLPGCPYRFSESGGLPFSDENPAYGLQIHHPRFLEFVGAPESALTPGLFADVLGGSVGQGTSDGSGHQPTAGCRRHVVKYSDTITVRNSITQNVILDDGLGHWTVIVSGSRSRRLVAGATSSSGSIVYVGHGPVAPSDGSG